MIDKNNADSVHTTGYDPPTTSPPRQKMRLTPQGKGACIHSPGDDQHAVQMVDFVRS